MRKREKKRKSDGKRPDKGRQRIDGVKDEASQLNERKEEIKINIDGNTRREKKEGKQRDREMERQSEGRKIDEKARREGRGKGGKKEKWRDRKPNEERKWNKMLRREEEKGGGGQPRHGMLNKKRD